MKKEKTVRTYQRRTKSGKMVTVHEHKASYDAAEEARKAAAKKAGAGSELSKKKAVKEESPLGFSADDYKEWYHWDMDADPKNEAALRVEKALTKKMGKRAYNKYLEDMTKSYTARGHKKAHQALLDEHTAQQKKQDAESSKVAKDIARGAKETSAELRKRAAEMDAREKKAKITEKVGKGYKTIKNAQLNNPAPRSRTGLLRGNVYISSDGKTAYYEDPFNKGKLKKASATLLSRLTKGKEKSKESISEQSLNSRGFKTFKMPQIGTLYLGKRGKGAYIKFKGKRNIQKADIDDYEDFITGHNGLTKAQKKQLSSLGYTEHEEY